MRRLAKKIAASALALTLVLAMGVQCFGAGWTSYFGSNEGWYEGSSGELASSTETGFVANIDTLGWGGVWGGQIHKEGLKVVKGKQYTLSFTMTSSNIDHWVYIKMAEEETIAYNGWIQLKAGKPYKFNQTFTAKANAASIYFGVGGDAGDRAGVTTDKDAEIRYAALPGYDQLLSGVDVSAATQIKCTDFKLTAAKPAKVKLTKVKALKGSKASVKYKKIKGVAGYQIQYSAKKNMKKAKAKTTKKTTYTLKKLKGKRVYVRVRAYLKGKLYGDWSAKKSVKIKK